LFIISFVDVFKLLVNLGILQKMFPNIFLAQKKCFQTFFKEIFSVSKHSFWGHILTIGRTNRIPLWMFGMMY